MMTGGEILVQCLVRYDVRAVFGIPGYHNLPIYDALYHNSDIQPIVACHEAGAAFMADGFARATGDVGVCLTTAGPGVTNASTGLGEAYGDSVPILLISGDIRTEAIGKEVGAYHEMDLLTFTRAITKWNGMALRVEEIPHLMERAFEALKTGRPRPAHLTIPVDVLKANGEIPVPGQRSWEKKPVEDKFLEKAIDKILRSERPLILAGGGTIASNATGELIAFAEALQAPTLFTRMGKGSIPEDHPLCFGYSRMNASGKLVRESDCMIALGVRFTDLSTETWPEPPHGLVMVNIDPLEMGKIFVPEVSVIGDVKQFLLQAIERIAGKNYHPGPEWKQELSKMKREMEETESSTPRRIFDSRDLGEVLPRNAIVAVDVCVPGYAMFSEFKVYEPRTYFAPTLFIAMGYGLPAAIGAKVAFPERTVVSVSGNAGFLMTCGELGTAKKYSLGVVSIVINDGCFQSIKIMQDADYGGRRIGIDPQPVDFVKLAAAFDVPGMKVTKAGQLKPALEKALAGKGPYLIEVVL